MSADALHLEIKRLIKVCEQLDSLAGRHPQMEEALLGISGSIRRSTTLLEVLMATRVAD